MGPAPGGRLASGPIPPVPMPTIPPAGRPLRPAALLGLLALLASGAPALSGCDNSEPASCDSSDTFSTENTTPEGTQLGAKIALGDCVAVDYVGQLADGSGTFDAGTLRFFYTSGRTIPGFFLGLAEMQVGESRQIRIPPSLGYGTREIPDSTPNDERVGIPSCSTLLFDVTLQAIYQDGRQCG